MKILLKIFKKKPSLAYQVVAFLALSIFARPAEAMFVPAAPRQDSTGAAAVS